MSKRRLGSACYQVAAPSESHGLTQKSLSAKTHTLAQRINLEIFSSEVQSPDLQSRVSPVFNATPCLSKWRVPSSLEWTHFPGILLVCRPCY
ncbi:hypothetical protein I7I50_03729 [Histoplasma capsulatum G186AR]|uniref:Uncharacterized protein n=1 Tax=Ajellomyces capsulatus TaxID=5037 RepID=A0A8H7YJ45_AJECA|nr:hypothetical protein I7I52_04636 [Histoplasma capsulatum]QSS74800.1 hypothetical protein I7I50_03729 [Histoplasma capsulatum G186AR]